MDMIDLWHYKDMHPFRDILNQLGSQSIMIGWYNIPYKTHVWKYMKKTDPGYLEYITMLIEQFGVDPTWGGPCPMYFGDVFIHPEF